MATQNIELKAKYVINSYCTIHPDQDMVTFLNQRASGLIDAMIQPCPQCLAESESFGRDNQNRDNEREGNDSIYTKR